jgi:hypothetical protein
MTDFGSLCHGSNPVMDEDRRGIGIATLQSVEGQNLNFAILFEEVSVALLKSPRERVAGSAPPLPTRTPAIQAKA